MKNIPSITTSCPPISYSCTCLPLSLARLRKKLVSDPKYKAFDIYVHSPALRIKPYHSTVDIEDKYAFFKFPAFRIYWIVYLWAF